MQNLFGSDFFSGNRDRLLAGLKKHDAPIVVTASGQLQASADNPFPFHQDPSFWYLTGIEQADYVLVIDKRETYVIAPTRSHVQDLFDGTADLNGLTRTSGINAVLDQTEGWKKLESRLQKSKRVYTLQPYSSYNPLYGMYANPARARLVSKLRRLVSGLEVVDVRPDLAKLRVIKQAPEIAAIRRAVTTTADTLNDVQSRQYANEYEVEADITQGFRGRGMSGHAYSPIVAGGANACVLHYLDNNDALNTGELILADVGAEYSHYAADLTRTWTQGRPTSRQLDVFNAVDEAVQFGIGQLKPGPSFYECEQKVREFVGAKLKQLGLIERTDKESVYKFYPHAPHYLGLDVHDVGDTRQPLKPGMVLTIEPGIYIPDENIGIRLEEDILITENGHEVLSKACPRALTSVQ